VLPFLGLVLALAFALPSASARSTDAKPAARQHAVVSENPRVTEEALRILRLGGNAADAAVTAALVAGVVSPSSSGLGGGCFINSFDAKRPESPWILDARETAPAELVAADFDRPFEFAERGKWVGVPGELAGLYELHRRQGRLSWQRVVEPAARVAERGFAISPHLAFITKLTQKSFAGDPSLSRLWLSPLRKEGSWIKTPRLGATLRRIAQGGPRVFYEGDVAAELVNTTRAAGGWLTLEDLARYQPKERPPLRSRFGAYDVFTMPAPSAGGLMLTQTLGLFSTEELFSLGHNTPAYQHVLAEAFRAAFADRMRFVGDPDLEAADLQSLISSEYLRARRADLSPLHTRALPRFTLDEQGTHHLIVADAEGNVVSLTTTVNRVFGAKLTAERSGIVLNDQLGDFAIDAELTGLGLAKNPNRPRPLARPVSSMTPTLFIKDGRVALAAGGSGGMNIGPEVTQAVLGHLVFGLEPERAVAAARFQVPPLGAASLLVTADTSAAHRRELQRRGEVVKDVRFAGTAVQMLGWDGAQLRTGADPRKHGSGKTENAPRQ
jgi:gamma-glutamyltranspeptidase/glutathione hydrolase